MTVGDVRYYVVTPAITMGGTKYHELVLVLDGLEHPDSEIAALWADPTKCRLDYYNFSPIIYGYMVWRDKRYSCRISGYDDFILTHLIWVSELKLDREL